MKPAVTMSLDEWIAFAAERYGVSEELVRQFEAHDNVPQLVKELQAQGVTYDHNFEMTAWNRWGDRRRAAKWAARDAQQQAATQISDEELAPYLRENGYYSEVAIMQAAGMNEQASLFFGIFGDGDNADDPDALPAPYRVLLDAARQRNAAREEAQEQEKEVEARALVQQPEPWSHETWKRLVELRFATRSTEDGGEQSYMSTSYSLTKRGERLLDPNHRAPGLYDDQVGIDG